MTPQQEAFFRRFPASVQHWAKLRMPVDFDEQDAENILLWIQHLINVLDPLICTPKRIRKVTWKGALKFYEAWHKANLKHLKKKNPYTSGLDDTLHVLSCSDGYEWVQIVTNNGLRFEGHAMGNCLGKDEYPTLSTFNNAVLSLRDQNNKPHCTVLMEKYDPFEPNNTIEQIRARFNADPYITYAPYIQALINYLKPLRVDDVVQFGRAYVERDHQKCILPWDKLCPHDLLLGDYRFSDHPFPQNLPSHLVFTKSLIIGNRQELTYLPDHLTILNCLDVFNIHKLGQFPKHLRVQNHIRLGNVTSDSPIVENFRKCIQLERHFIIKENDINRFGHTFSFFGETKNEVDTTNIVTTG